MTTTRLNDLFDQLEPEKGNKLDDKIQVDDGELQDIINTMYKIDRNVMGNTRVTEQPKYLNSIMPYNFSAKGITKFSKLLTLEIIQQSARLHVQQYLNQIIQNSPDQDHDIDLSNVEKTFSIIGQENTKNIIMRSEMGSRIGFEMKSGRIEINGNAGDSLGMIMKSGKIIVNGNAYTGLGFGMNGGKITVNGNADQGVGELMNGGNIIVNGEIKSLGGRIHGGNIYQHEKQIVRNGEILYKKYLR